MLYWYRGLVGSASTFSLYSAVFWSPDFCSGNIQATQEIQPGRFLLRRGLKIYPQFYFFIAAMVAAACIQGVPLRTGQVLAEVAFVQNYFSGMWGHTWSLAIEEHFYLLLTAAIVIMARRGGTNPFRALPVWILAVCAAVLGLRIVTWRLHSEISGYLNVFPSHLRIDSLMTGVLISYFHSFYPADLARWMRRLGGWVPPASILMLAPVTFLTREDPFMVTAGFSLVSWGFGLLLLSVLYPAKRPPAPSGLGRAMARLGKVSYAFYLWQGPILVAGDRLKSYALAHGVFLPLPLIITVTFAASLLAAVVTTRLIELPALRMRDRCFPR